MSVLQKMNLNKIKVLFQKFNLLEGVTKDGDFVMNKEDTFNSLLSNLDS